MTTWKNLLLDTAEHMAHWLGFAAIYGSNFEELNRSREDGSGLGRPSVCSGTVEHRDLFSTLTLYKIWAKPKRHATRAVATKRNTQRLMLQNLFIVLLLRLRRECHEWPRDGYAEASSYANDRVTRADTLQTLTPSNWGTSHKWKGHKGHSYHLESYWGSGDE